MEFDHLKKVLNILEEELEKEMDEAEKRCEEILKQQYPEEFDPGEELIDIAYEIGRAENVARLPALVSLNTSSISFVTHAKEVSKLILGLMI